MLLGTMSHRRWIWLQQLGRNKVYRLLSDFACCHHVPGKIQYELWCNMLSKLVLTYPTCIGCFKTILQYSYNNTLSKRISVRKKNSENRGITWKNFFRLVWWKFRFLVSSNWAHLMPSHTSLECTHRQKCSVKSMNNGAQYCRVNHYLLLPLHINYSNYEPINRHSSQLLWTTESPKRNIHYSSVLPMLVHDYVLLFHKVLTLASWKTNSHRRLSVQIFPKSVYTGHYFDILLCIIELLKDLFMDGHVFLKTPSKRQCKSPW